MIKRLLSAVIAVLMLISMSACSVISGDISELFTPPKLSDEQQAILNAISAAVGDEYTLKNAYTGTTRSSIAFEDMDGDETDEAIVFYTSTGNTAINILFLNKYGEKWESAGSIIGDSNEMYQYEFADIDGDNAKDLLVGWDISLSGNTQPTSSIATKGLNIYSCQDNEYKSIYSTGYAYMLKVNLDADSKDEVAIITSEAIETADETTPFINKLSIISCENSIVSPIASIDLYPGVASYVNIMAGKEGDEKNSIFLDAKLHSGTYVTQIIQIENYELVNLFPELETNPTLRTPQITCMDINNDTIIEFPICSVLPDYEENTDTARYLTDWCTFDKSSVSTAMSTIISTTFGYYINVYGQWKNKITIESKPDQSLLIVREPNNNLTGNALFYIKRFTETDSAKAESQGYTILFHSNGFIIAAALDEYGKKKYDMTIQGVSEVIQPFTQS